MPSYLDLAVIMIVLVSGMLALLRGFTREVLAIASWVAAAAAAYYLHPLALPYLKPYISKEEIALAASVAVVFFVALIVVSLFTVKLSDIILDSKIGALDRSLGFVFGAVRGLLLAVVAFLFYAWLRPRDEPAGLGQERPRQAASQRRRREAARDVARRRRRHRREDQGQEGRPSSGGRGAAVGNRAGEGRRPAGRAGAGEAVSVKTPHRPRLAGAGSGWHIWARRPARGALHGSRCMSESTPFPSRIETTDDLDGDRLREYCGVFGVFGFSDAAAITALGLHALQHRGQEAAGIVSYDAGRFHGERRLGLVGDHFSKESTIKRLPGSAAIGHVRYATTGETMLRNVQPLFAELNTGGFAVAHNGNLTNAQALRRDLIKEGAIFQSTSDTEVILHLVARSRKPQLVDRFIEALRSIEGAYSLVALSNKKLIGARDPLGIRPLVIGELDGKYILASESCALDIIGARFVRDVKNARSW